jgi:hypothetical protein
MRYYKIVSNIRVNPCKAQLWLRRYVHQPAGSCFCHLTSQVAPKNMGKGKTENEAMTQDNGVKTNLPTSQDDVLGLVPSQFNVIKTFPPRGEWQQYRLAACAKFSCNRCQKPKTSKHVTIKEGNWGQLWCNGCYGLLVSTPPES